MMGGTMRGTKTHAYRAAVAVAFGLIGFGVNFLDIEFVEGATFKISILAGLFFPLVVALAWGWRYGLLSALAGGSQTMWWLWYGDGWGVLYAVPVFTLWIVWHGWWAERRSDGHPWYLASFAVEIPFRIVIELGFLVVFRWLVSLNPPPWNPAASWDQVSSAWLHTVAIKHLVAAYVLLAAAHVALSLGAVRRFFGLPPRPAQRDTTAIYAGAALFGLLLWTLDALVHYVAFPREGQTFWGIAVHGTSAPEVFMRSVYMAAAMFAGVVLARVNRRRTALQELLDHRNRVLAAIRNVNQLIVREKNPLRLLDEACRLLVEQQGYGNVWIVLMTDGRPQEPFFHAGLEDDFAPMAARLRAGELPRCAQAALSSDRVHVEEDPPTHCAACPLACAGDGHAGVSLRLEHAGRLFGWMSLSCPETYARSAEEHDLLTEVAGDIAFALWAIEAQTQRETLAVKYAAVLATTNDAVIAGDLDGMITVFNPGAEQLFGCSADEVLGSPFTRFCPEDRLEEQAELMRRVRDTGVVPAYETQRLTADGRRVPVEVTLSLQTDAHGRPQAINGIFRDITDRKQAETALRESRDLLEITQRLAKIGGWQWDVDGQRMSWTDEAYRIHEFEPGEVEAGSPAHIQRSLACYTPDDREAIEAAFRRCVEKGTPYDLEVPFTTARGRRRWVRTAAQALMEGDRVVNVIGHIMDITDRKQAEDGLRRSEEQFRHLVENQTDLVAKLDLEGRFLFVSPAVCKLFGKTEEELLGTTSMPFVHEEDIGTIDEARTALMAPPHTAYLEQRTMTTKGWLWLAWVDTAVLDGDGNVKEIIAVGRDISDIKRAETALVEQKDLLAAIYRNAPLIMMVVNADRRIQQINGFATAFANRDEEEMLGLRGGDALRCMHVLDAPQGCGFGDFCQQCVIRNTVLDTLETGEAHVQIEAPYYSTGEDNDIRELRFLMSTTPIEVKGERMVLVTLQDITERRRTEAENEKLQSQLSQAQKMESVGRLAGGVAHDFNNMLGVILGHAEMALERMDSDQPFYGDFAEIRTAAERSADLTRQLLTFARKQTIAPRIIDLNATVEGLWAMLRRLIGEDIELTWRAGENLAPVKVDPSQIDQILVNLCVNARDAIDDVGKITIETDRVSFDEAYCALHAGFVPGDYVLLAVSDNGRGMDQETLDHSFEPFFTTKAQGKGTGLGLASVYGAVKQNNGFINVYSEPGHGTTIKIYLPQQPTHTTHQADQASATPAIRGNETILLVEDEPSILRLATMMLERLGYVVLAANTPGEAIRRAHEHRGPIDLLMTDVVMPEMNGRDLAKNLLAAYPDIKRLFMSGYTANVIAHHGVLDEGVHFIQKPFSSKDLEVTLREVLDDQPADSRTGDQRDGRRR